MTEFQSEQFKLISIYAPVKSQALAGFYRQLNPMLLERKHLILIGDFNCVLNNLNDRIGPGREKRDTYNSELKTVEQ